MPRIGVVALPLGSVVSSIGALDAMPALETTMSTPPNARTARVERRAHRLLRGHVAGHREAVVAERRHRGGGAVAVEVERRRRRRRRREGVDDRPADPARRAR